MPKVTANGIEVFYELSGPEDAPVVVFSNSLGSTVEMWDGVVPTVSRRFRCLRYDTRGHGRSGSSAAPITIDDLADDLAALLDALGIGAAHVAGLSLGGMTAMALASRRPERVASLMLIATSPYLPPADFWNGRAETVRTRGAEAVVDTIVPRWFTAPFRERDPEAVRAVRQAFLGIEPAGYGRCCEALGAMDIRDRLAKITAPTLVLVGAEDPVTPPAMAEHIRQRIPGAELVVLPRAAHLISVESPAAVAAHLCAFLDRQAADSGQDDNYTRGLANRRAILGATHVDNAMAKAGAFGAPWQEFITRVAWGEIWDDPTLPRKTRSLLTLAMMIALHREEEFKLHVRPAVGNGATIAELRALAMHASVYAGVPAANAAFRWLREVLGDEVK
jgi:3-oxoadipate enol-lactonase/4-carboxymuconolactone decarboxylase